MAVKSTEKDGKLFLEIDNGDLEKLKTCMDEWKFKDHQSFLRFAVSIMIVTEDQDLWIKSKGQQQQITPADDYIEDKG